MTQPAHAERAHAVLGASGADRWINCPPSARLQEHIPDKISEYADEGTAAHELSELILRRRLTPVMQLNANDLIRPWKNSRKPTHITVRKWKTQWLPMWML